LFLTFECHDVCSEEPHFLDCFEGFQLEHFVADRVDQCCKLLDFLVVTNEHFNSSVGIPVMVEFVEVCDEHCIGDGAVGAYEVCHKLSYSYFTVPIFGIF